MPTIRQRATGSVARIAAILLLPALFSMFGVWEIVRGKASIAGFEPAQARVTSQLGRLQQFAQANPHATVRFNGDERSYAAPVAAHMMAAHADELDTDLLVARARLPFAWLTALAASLALAGGLAGLIIASLAARRSMRSRDALVRSFGQVRRLVPVALGCQVGGVALALVGIVGFECAGMWFPGTLSGADVRFVGAGLIAAGLALWGAFQSIRQLRRASGLFEPHPAELLGVPVTEAQAPGLFALMRELARDQEAVVPQTVVAGAVAGFFVTSHPHRLAGVGEVVRGRILHVPLPHLAVFSRAETRVVLAHELAHFSGEDTAYSTHFQPVYAALQQSMVAVATRRRGRYPILDRMLSPASSLGEHVLVRFDHTVKHWSRLREFEADKGALATEQPDALATSLLRAGVTSRLVDAQLRAMAEHPDRGPADLVQQTLQVAGQQGFIEPGRYLDERQPHPTDTHPPTVQRIAAAGVTVDDGLLARAARPVDAGELAAVEALFADWPGLCAAVTTQLRGVAVRQQQTYLAQVAAAASSVGEAPVELHERRVRIMIALGVTALFCLGLGGGLAWLLMSSPPDPADSAIAVMFWAAIVFLLGGFASCFGIVRLARNRAPFLVLTADGFSSPGFSGIVSWTAVAGVTVLSGRGVTTILTLAPGQTLPPRTGRIWRLRARRRRNALVFSELTPRGLKARAYLDLLLAHRRAALAREELARRDRLDPARGFPG